MASFELKIGIYQEATIDFEVDFMMMIEQKQTISWALSS